MFRMLPNICVGVYMQKLLTTLTVKLFRKKAPSEMFGKVLSTLLCSLRVFYYWTTINPFHVTGLFIYRLKTSQK